MPNETTEPMIPLACVRDMIEAIMRYVPEHQRRHAEAAAVAVGVGYEPK